MGNGRHDLWTVVSKCRALVAAVLDGGDEQQDIDATKRCKVHTNQLCLHATDAAICATALGHAGGMAGHTDHRAAKRVCDHLHLSPISSPPAPLSHNPRYTRGIKRCRWCAGVRVYTDVETQEAAVVVDVRLWAM